MKIAIIICIFIVGFILVHLIKFIRLYLVLLEQKIPFFQFACTYCKTTFINLLIPFKLGEIYRVLCFSKLSGTLEIGIFSVLADRFFDTFALLLILLPFELLTTGSIQIVTAALAVLLVTVLFIYRTFPDAYTYLNHYLIQEKSSRRSMAVLRGLDRVKIWYEYVRELVEGRHALIFFFSFIGWVAEIGVLWALSKIVIGYFGAADFSGYIAAIFLAGSSRLLRVYVGFSALIMGAATVVAYGLAYRKKHIRSKRKGVI